MNEKELKIKQVLELKSITEEILIQIKMLKLKNSSIEKELNEVCEPFENKLKELIDESCDVLNYLKNN